MHHLANPMTHCPGGLSPQTLSVHVIYLMGLSFVLGTFFTILILLLLDFMKRNRPEEP